MRRPHLSPLHGADSGRCALSRCARLNRVPTYRVSGKYYLRAAVGGRRVGHRAGSFMGLDSLLCALRRLFQFHDRGAVGYGIGEGISLALTAKPEPFWPLSAELP